jgi:ketosteroid isomerase-like protein
MTDPADFARTAFETLAEQGVEAMLAYVHPDFRMETLPGIAAEPQVYRGHDGVRLWFDSFLEVMDEIVIVPDEITDLGGQRVLVQFSLRATGQSSGLEVEQKAAAVATLRDEKLVSLEFLQPGEPFPAPEG